MKKLIIAAFAAILGIAANAAAVEWSMTGISNSPDATKAAGWAVYVMDASTFDTFATLTGSDIATYAADNAIYSGATVSARGGAINATIKNGNFSANDTVSSYLVVFNNATAADATYYAYTEAKNVTINAGGSDAAIAFGAFDSATAATGGWTQAVPEPTSGLLMLVGLAGLALRRRRA